MPDVKTGRYEKGERASVATEFKPGLTPWNKGIAYTKISGEKHPFWKGGKPNCLDCGKKLGTYKTKRCSPCHLKSPGALANILEVTKRRNTSGANHPNWKGGVTPENNRLRVLFRRTTQPLVFQRDNFTCQVCSQHGGYLQVDHIQNWADHPELRFDLDNCRTLCMACHYYVTFKRKLPRGVIWGHRLNQRII